MFIGMLASLDDSELERGCFDAIGFLCRIFFGFLGLCLVLLCAASLEAGLQFDGGGGGVGIGADGIAAAATYRPARLCVGCSQVERS